VEKRNAWSRVAPGYTKWGKFPLPVSYGYSSPRPKEACLKPSISLLSMSAKAASWRRIQKTRELLKSMEGRYGRWTLTRDPLCSSRGQLRSLIHQLQLLYLQSLDRSRGTCVEILGISFFPVAMRLWRTQLVDFPDLLLHP
jgi:hypothetical protein